MYRTWSAQAPEAEDLARLVEQHLNEFAADVISVAYSVDRVHHVLVVYRPIDLELEARDAVTVAEQIIDTSP